MTQGRPKNDPGQRFSGPALKAIAQARGFTSTEIAGMYGCSVAKISTWYRHPRGAQSRPPRKDEVRWLSKLLRVPTDAFSSMRAANSYIEEMAEVRSWLR